MKALALSAAVLGAALSAARADGGEKRAFPLDGVKALKVQAESGLIEVLAGKTLEVEVTGNAKPERCLLTLEVKGGALNLKAESAQRWFVAGDGCKAGFRVSAPAGLPLDAKNGSGDIRASGRMGAVHLGAGSGDVTLDSVSGEAALAAGSGKISGTLSGRLTAKCGSGGVSLAGLAAGADVKSGSGDVRLTWAAAPAGSVSVKSGSGGVRLSFPKGTRLSANQVSGSGTAVNKLGEDPTAALKVSVMTGSGDSTID